MKLITPVLLLFLGLPAFCMAQFGADYSSYGFNFVNDTYNNGLRGWQGGAVGNTAKLSIYKQDPANRNNYALKFKAQNETVPITYNDNSYMDLNACSFVANLRLNIPQFTGNEEGFTFKLNTGTKLVLIRLSNTGIYYLNNNATYTYLAAAPPTNVFKTYTIALNSCSVAGTLMIENDQLNMLSLTLPDDTSPQSIEMSAYTTGNTQFEADVDHLMIYSNPKKWWLGSATPYIDETNYVGTTGDRQHYLNLPNGQRIGVNENAGGYIPYLQLQPGGPNIDPNPKFGSGSTKTLRGYFHSADYNPVQAGTSSTTGGHLATVHSGPGQITTDPFPLHLYYKSGITEHNLLTFPDGNTMTEFDNSATGDDLYPEYGLDMRHEIITELDFSSTLDDISKAGGISVVRHRAEWSYIRHSCQILQYSEPISNYRFTLDGSPISDADMGGMRHKFEFRMNKDYGYQWVLWRENNAWQSLFLNPVGAEKVFNSTSPTSISADNRLMIFSTSSDPNDPNAIAWYYPESSFNTNGTVERSRADKSLVAQKDRRYRVDIIADWNKTNWCRMNLYVFNKGLYAPQNDNPHTYESFQMEAYQLFGTPNQILAEVQGAVLTAELLQFNVITEGGQNILNWATALPSARDNNKSFDIERSHNGETFQTIGTVKALGKATNYTFADTEPINGINYYRLRQHDNDGTESYSKVISVANKGGKRLNLYPTLVSNGFLTLDTEGGDYAIYNVFGQQVQSGQITQRLDVSALTNGIYVFKLGAEQVKFVKQ